MATRQELKTKQDAQLRLIAIMSLLTDIADPEDKLERLAMAGVLHDSLSTIYEYIDKNVQ